MSDAGFDLQQLLNNSKMALEQFATVTIGVTPKQLIYAENKLKLYRYVTENHAKKPVILIVFSLINRPSILDLCEECSMVATLIQQGFTVYLLDWGYPDLHDATLSLNDYISDYLHQCVLTIVNIHQQKINLLGVCQGGVFNLCYSILFPDYVKRLILISTPINFHHEENILWKLYKDIDVDLLVQCYGNIPGNYLKQVFFLLKPFELTGKKYLKFLKIAADAIAVKKLMCVKKWINDTPDQAGIAFKQFFYEFYRNNSLITKNLRLNDQPVLLQGLTVPVLNIICQHDHIIPPVCSEALKSEINNIGYTEVTFPAGHIGIYLNNKIRLSMCSAISIWIKK